MMTQTRRWIIGLGLLAALPLIGLTQDRLRPTEGRNPLTQARRSIQEVRENLRQAQDVLSQMPEGRGRTRLEALLRQAQDNTAQALWELDGKGRREPISPENFAQLKKQLLLQGFDDKRVAFLRAASPRNFFTSRQVREILTIFRFDPERGEAAVALYPRMTDPGNFFQVLDVFLFESERQKVLMRISQLEGS
jgi:hypothetical protein